MKYGYVQYYGRHSGLQPKLLAFVVNVDDKGSIITDVHRNTLSICVPHIHAGKPSSVITVIEIDRIVGICTNVTLPETGLCFICEPPNREETD